MNKSKLISFLISAIILIACLIAFPSSALALTSEEVKDLANNAWYYYEDGDENKQWVFNNGKYYRCVVDNSTELNNVTQAVREKMLAKEETIKIYVATNNKAYKVNEAYDIISNTVRNSVYNVNTQKENSVEAVCGDYLKWTTAINSQVIGGILEASHPNGEDSANGYYYHQFTFTVAYKETVQMQSTVKSFADQWQNVFITNNKTIQSARTINEKNYYIAKTIYSFLSDNTYYDTLSKEHTEEKPTVSAGQYKNSHSAYGAFIGKATGTDGAVDFSCYDWSTCTDSMGLTRIKKLNQGLSVCDGYTLAAYYLCKLNGIDCRIVDGDFTKDSGNNSDPHAWNVIMLSPSSSDTYGENARWYYFDATFAATSPVSVNMSQTGLEDYSSLSIIDYAYFLRGTANKAFDAPSHQQLSTAFAGIDEQDYKFTSSSIKCESTWAVLTRRKDIEKYLEIENYFLISPDRTKYYKINIDKTDKYNIKYSLTECKEDFEKNIIYNGNAYYYNLNIQDFANGIDYTAENQYLKDSGEYNITAKTIDGSKALYSLGFNILPLDMSDWSGYSNFWWTDGTNKTDIVNSDLTNAAKIPFKGAPIVFSVEIIDAAGALLVKDTQYSVVCKSADGSVISKPCLPGNYIIEINFDIKTDNYKGILKIPFEITKGDFSSFNIESKEVSYGSDILSGCGSLDLGQAGVTLKNGIDYFAYLENPSMINCGNEGYIIYTALPSSNYLQAGTSIKRHYKVVNPIDLSEIFNNKSTGAVYNYTGAEIRHNLFQIQDTTTGEIYTLKENVDYVINGYENNINVGTAYVNISFIGNYCGNARMSFQIVSSGNSNNMNTAVQNQISNNQQQIIFQLDTTPKDITGKKSKATKNSVTISWDSQGNNFIYEIYTYDIASKKWRLMAITSDNYFTAAFAVKNNKKSKFLADTKYKYKVRAYSNYVINGVEKTEYGKFTVIEAVTKVSTPKSAKIKKAKKSFKASWKKVKNAQGYEIQYSTDKKFKKGKKTCTVKKGKATSATVKKLKSSKTYYVRIRAYQTVNGKKVYSACTKTIKIKIK